MKTVRLLIVGFSFVASLVVQRGASQSLSLILRLDTDHFLESQGIWVYVTLINGGPATQEVPPFILTDDRTQGVRFHLFDQSEQRLVESVTGTYDDFGLAKPKSIAVGDSLAAFFNIITMFSNSGVTRAPAYLPTVHYLKTGSYTLYFSVFTGKGTVHSNKVTFSVVRPKGKELEALREIKEADTRYEDFRQKDDVQRTVAYESFLSRFHNSTYTPYAYKQLVFLYYHPRHDTQKALQLIWNLAQRFPNQGQTIELLTNYAPVFIREGRQDILERLSRDFPETRVGQLSRRKLQELQQR